MHRQAFDFIAARARDLGRVGFVLEIGARNINGTIKNCFDAERYVGLDVSPGPGVDVVASGADYVPDTPPDVIVCCEVLEHTEEAAAICQRAIENLAPGGVLLLTMAGTGRAPHSAVDGCDLREGEFYRNVSVEALGSWLDGCCSADIKADHEACDTYAVAVKAGDGARLRLAPTHLKSVLLWNPGASISTKDVAAGLEYGLKTCGVEVLVYDTEREIKLARASLMHLWNEQGKPSELTPGDVEALYRAGKMIVADAARARILHGTEWVIVVSGMYQHPDFFRLLRTCGFKVALLCTESPYDLEHETRLAPEVDAVFTNERSAVDAFRSKGTPTGYLPHAWHPGVHAAMQAGEAEIDVLAHDVVFVGTYFEERNEFLSAIDWTGIDLGLYGGTNEIDLRTKAGRALRPFIRGAYLQNAKTAALYRKARIGLNLHRTSKGFGPNVEHIAHAESLNPRCYELAATGCFFISDYRSEVVDVFGDRLWTFATPQECEALIRRALADETSRRVGSDACREAVAPHDWKVRAAKVVKMLGQVDAQLAERAA